MKKSFVSIVLLIVLMASLFPSAVFAKDELVKAPQVVSVDVYNHSGSALTVLLTNKNTGTSEYLQLETGVTMQELVQGTYDYTVTTPCGLETGTWNVTQGRELFITCSGGSPSIILEKFCHPTFRTGSFGYINKCRRHDF